MSRWGAGLLLVALAGPVPLAGQEVVPGEGAADATAVPEGNTAHADLAEGIEVAGADRPAPISLSPEKEERARRLADRLKCPVCRSQSVRQSNSFMAEDMERKIRVLVSEGKSDEEIVEYFTSRFGQYILLSPPKRGFNLTAWLVPFVVVGVGGFGVFLATRRWRRSEPIEPSAAEEVPEDSPYLKRLERELKETE